jgi:TatD DNase family protein
MRTAHRAGVRAIVTSGVAPDDWPDALEIAQEITGAQQAPSVRCALGLHPYAVSRDEGRNRDALAQLSERLDQRAMSSAQRDAWIALGECGLDFRKGMPFAPREVQLRVLAEQLELARKHELPCVVHCVQAHGALLELLDDHVVAPSVMHAFSGSAEVALSLADRGHYLSFAGSLTRGDAKRLHRAAAAVPLERVLIESDSPDQTPQGRGAVPNEPAFVVDIARALAHHREESVETIAHHSFTNACRVYGWSPESHEAGR